MEKVFTKAYETSLTNVGLKKDVVRDTSKIDDLEKELRGDTIDERGQQESQSAGTAQEPTSDQKRLQKVVAPQDVAYGMRENTIADYSLLLGQMNEDRMRFAVPMLASTISAQRPVERLATASDQVDMLSSQLGLHHRSTKMYKKAMKNPKLSFSDSFL